MRGMESSQSSAARRHAIIPPPRLAPTSSPPPPAPSHPSLPSPAAPPTPSAACQNITCCRRAPYSTRKHGDPAAVKQGGSTNEATKGRGEASGEGARCRVAGWLIPRARLRSWGVGMCLECVCVERKTVRGRNKCSMVGVGRAGGACPADSGGVPAATPPAGSARRLVAVAPRRAVGEGPARRWRRGVAAPARPPPPQGRIKRPMRGSGWGERTRGPRHRRPLRRPPAAPPGRGPAAAPCYQSPPPGAGPALRSAGAPARRQPCAAQCEEVAGMRLSTKNSPPSMICLGGCPSSITPHHTCARGEAEGRAG